MKTDVHNKLVDYKSLFWTPDFVEVSAWIEHIPFAFWLIEVLKPKSYVELGVHAGVSYFSFCQAVRTLNLNTSCYGVDTWQGDEHAGFYNDAVYEKVVAHNTDKFSRFSTLIRSTFDEAREYFIDGSIDLLHIDGLHTYEAVKRDFEAWRPKLSKNAIVLFHDINVREREFGVFKCWEELKRQYRTLQFDFGHGLGVLALGKVDNEDLNDLLNDKESGPLYTFIRNLFSERGSVLKEKRDTALLMPRELNRAASQQAALRQLIENYNTTIAINTSLQEQNQQLASNNETLQSKHERLQDTFTSYKQKNEKLIENLNKELQRQQQVIQWYKATYEDRSILGILKQKIGSGKKTNKNNRFQLKPMNDISNKNDSNEYSVEGIDPFFIVNLENKQLKAGWYYLSIEIEELKEKIVAPKLYYNYGRGFNEQDVWKLPSITNSRITSLVYFPGNITDLRFDPTTSKAVFTIKGFHLKKLSKSVAFRHGLRTFKDRFYPGTNYFTFWLKMLGTFFKTGKFDLRNRIKYLIYNIESQQDTQDYKKWCKLYDTVTESDFKKIQSLSENLAYKPMFSVIMPVYNAPVSYLEKAIESVINQAYPYWELCIADDKSTQKGVARLLKKYEAKDQRIKVVYRETNGHISNASNSALELATGDYIVLLDQDDEIPANCLYIVARTINDNRNLELIYSDEDKIDEMGNRFDPYFKTDWNIDLFYGQNMISHLGVYKHSLIKQIGGFRAGYEGSQDYDLALRCIDHLQPEQIQHIPHILYHWRAIEGSTAVTMENKNYAFEAGIKALRDHFQRTGKNATVVENAHNSYRVKWNLPEYKPLASIIIPTKDKVNMLADCVHSILSKTSYENYEVLIIDNNSEEPETYEFFEEIQKKNKKVKVLSYKNEFNFSALVNYGVAQSKGEVVLLLNNDTEVINEEWLHEMVSQACRKDIGAVGAKLFYENGQIQHAGVFLYEGHPGNHIYLKREQHDPGYFNKLNLAQNYSAVTAACLAISKELYNQVGGFDEKNLKVAYNDVDFCLKIRELGYRNLFTPFAQLFHYESQSRDNDMDLEQYPRFKQEHSFMLKKWEKALTRDPFYSPNLNPYYNEDPSVDKRLIQLAFPPYVKYEWQEVEIDNEQKS